MFGYCYCDLRFVGLLFGVSMCCAFLFVLQLCWFVWVFPCSLNWFSLCCLVFGLICLICCVLILFGLVFS